ncbi:MAG TPA: hypothetical protein VD930_02740 [Gemmatimonadales bacterium]|nr:hypothetical protein [Gemmatimonadales bacterium]
MTADTGVAAAQSALIDRDTTSTDAKSSAAAPAHQPVTKTDRMNAPDTSISGYQAMSRDSAGDNVVLGDSAEITRTDERLAPTEQSQHAHADTAAPDSASARVRPPEDSSETVGLVTTNDSVVANNDTAVSASPEMARDTTTTMAQADTVAQVQVDTTAQVTDTSTQVAADTGAAVQVQVDTVTRKEQTEVAVETPEPNQASAEANADTLATEDAGRIRPPENSAEVRATNADQVPAAAAGAKTSGNTITGAAAVAAITRVGQRCAVVDTEEAEQEIRWDLASSPATMNPCGTGTMTLPRIQGVR